MKQQLSHVLKHWPPLYHGVGNVYYAIKPHRNWSVRTIGEQYWSERNLPSKCFLADRIAAYSPSSVLEVGCASGPNLYQIARRLPQAQLMGIDINQWAVDYGNANLLHERIRNVRLMIGDAENLESVHWESYDVVFSSAVLIYIRPDKIQSVLHNMRNIAKKGLVLMELHDSKAKDVGSYWSGHWVRNYKALLSQFVKEEKIRIEKIPIPIWPGEPWREMGYIIEVKK